MSIEETFPTYDVGEGPRAGDGRPGQGEAAAAAGARLRALIDRHYSFVWRTLLYLGLPDGGVDDAAQQVLCVLARRLGDIQPGAEMSFLFSTAVRVASEARRTARRRPSVALENADACAAPGPTPEDLLDERRAHDALREIVEAIPLDLRVVFVLFEIEELTQAEISSLLGVAQGTVASRLRRAREKFRALVRQRSASLRVAPRKEAP